MTGVYIMLGGMVAFVTLIVVVDAVGRRQKRRQQRPNWRRVEALHAIVVAVH